MLRILASVDDTQPLASLDPLRPRLDKARTWIATHVPAQERTIVRSMPDDALLSSLDAQQQQWLDLLAEHLDDSWSLDSLTALVYGVPKLAAGMSLQDKPTDQVKKDQKAFFELLYRLFVSSTTGPRLPTLLLSLGASRIRQLIAR